MPELGPETIRGVRQLLNGRSLDERGWRIVEADPGWPEYTFGVGLSARRAESRHISLSRTPPPTARGVSLAEEPKND